MINMKRGCVIVLGDIGRSPRMQFHSLSLAKEGFEVDLVGYGGSKPMNELLSNERINIKNIKESHPCLQKLPIVFRYIFKVIWQIVTLLYALTTIKKPDFILVQTPPAVPTLAVVWFVALVRNCQLIIDWHNYGYTIMALSMKPSHPFVKFSRWFEQYFGKKAAQNLCVTSAMKDDLVTNWGLRNVHVVYDRPAEIYKPVRDTETIHNFFLKLGQEYEVFRGTDSTSTFLTDKDGITLKDDRPAFVISSTSWTEDEDFSILLSALEEYDKCAAESNLPKLVCVITGKGPLKQYYCDLFRTKNLSCVKICTPWLSPEDYATLLGCGDLGISLHFSSSGLDLPMKVVDMFGCCLPVCAVDFKCIDELVKHDHNGIVFKRGELASYLMQLFKDFPNKKDQLDKFRKNLQTFQEERWHESWKPLVLPLIE